MTRFVILAAPRTGSNLLCTLLNSHPEVLCHHELFNPQGIFYALEHREGPLDLGTVETRDRCPLAFLERVWQQSLGHAALGFKWTRGQHEIVLHHVLEDPDVVKVLLRRVNRVKTFVSEKVSQRTGQWEVYRGEKLAPRPRIRVGVEELQAHITRNQNLYDRIRGVLRQTGQSPVELRYEELTSRGALKATFAALGVQVDFKPVASSVKQNSRDLRDLIENFDDLAARLRGTELEAELHSLNF